MKCHEVSHRHHEALCRLVRLPRHILELHGHETPFVTEFILHELCHPHCFGFEKAAYLVDNPDFDCLKGVAGFYRQEHVSNEFLDFPTLFLEHLPSCHFNHRVRTVKRKSHRRLGQPIDALIKSLALELEIKNPYCFEWQLKHNNYGILVCQVDTVNGYEWHDYINDGIYLLSFCPIV